jgi:exodeoxyribonuclease-1
MERLNAFLIRTAVRYEDSEHVEENIYQGFPSRADAALLREFHRVSWEDRFSILSGFEDQRYKQLGQRLIAEHQPSALPVSVKERFENWVLERRTWNEDAPWNTEPRA